MPNAIPVAEIARFEFLLISVTGDGTSFRDDRGNNGHAAGDPKSAYTRRTMGSR